jgi:hypothetical protein
VSAVTASRYGTSSLFMSALFADQQMDGTEEFLKKMKKIRKCMFYVFLVSCWQIGLSVNEVFLPSSHIQSSATFKYTWK